MLPPPESDSGPVSGPDSGPVSKLRLYKKSEIVFSREEKTESNYFSIGWKNPKAFSIRWKNETATTTATTTTTGSGSATKTTTKIQPKGEN